MESFQNNIKEWVRYDNEAHRLQQELKKIREQKNNCLESIIDYSNRNSLNNHTIQISDGRLRISQYRQSNPLSLQFVEKCLQDVIQDSNHVEHIMNYIKEKRPHKIEQSLKRYYNK